MERSHTRGDDGGGVADGLGRCRLWLRARNGSARSAEFLTVGVIVDDHTMHLVCTVSGAPTVVMDAGLGG